MKVLGEGRMKESITRKRQASSIATVGSTCDLNLKIPGEERMSEVSSLYKIACCLVDTAFGLKLT